LNSKDFLHKIYTDKKQRNGTYSIRAFARDLDIPSGRLTEIFNGKRSLTVQLGEKISGKLGLSDEEKKSFIETISHDKKHKKKSLTGHEICLDIFEKVFSPNAYAILSLMETRGFRSDTDYIAERLGIARSETAHLLQELTAAGFITQNNMGKMKPHFPSTFAGDSVPSQVIRNYHKKVLAGVIEKIDAIEMTDRDLSAITMAIDKSKLEIAKKKIARFRRSLMKFLESGKKSEVYCLSVQLFPLTKPEDV
jgi:uncharacterized protein (TIGR02147 family)